MRNQSHCASLTHDILEILKNLIQRAGVIFGVEAAKALIDEDRIEPQIRGFQDLIKHRADGKSLKAGPQLVLPIEGFGQTAQRAGRLFEALKVLQFVGQTRL